MQELKAEKPPESPADSDPATRLMARLVEEGFTTDLTEEDWRSYGEIIYRRAEKISFAAGETVFIFTRVHDLNEKILRQTSEAVVNSYKARSVAGKALSVLQSTTVYHCLVADGDQPHNDLLTGYVTRAGGATFIPVIIVPDINQVIYPDLEEKVASVKPRVEYLQYLLGERRETVNMHRPTVQAMWVSLGVVILLLLAIAVSLIH
ncbi:MAG: hypothetical protein JO088_08790 [Acidobacteria bacterium]|nr:hypothetical protein [Acidobacteriota bacterium]MBV9071892.1 hypothetical protein [Acidobacteriota bacterium]